MKMINRVYSEILSVITASPIEMGGIIGMQSGVVTDCFFDLKGSEYGKYSPDVNTINEKIVQWIEKDIDFCGIFHSHYPIEEHLSSDDIDYIKSIMFSINECCDFLYFPIVIPKKKIVPYKAVVKDGKIEISSDELLVIDE